MQQKRSREAAKRMATAGATEGPSNGSSREIRGETEGGR